MKQKMITLPEHLVSLLEHMVSLLEHPISLPEHLASLPDFAGVSDMVAVVLFKLFYLCVCAFSFYEVGYSVFVL